MQAVRFKAYVQTDGGPSVETARVRRRGQITLPQTIRKRLDLQEGDQIAFLERGDEIVLLPLTKTLLDLRGSVPVSGVQDFDEVRRQTIETHVRKAVENGD
jgi:AbrB family looped-hinge helix DNA binding protein